MQKRTKQQISPKCKRSFRSHLLICCATGLCLPERFALKLHEFLQTSINTSEVVVGPYCVPVKNLYSKTRVSATRGLQPEVRLSRAFAATVALSVRPTLVGADPHRIESLPANGCGTDLPPIPENLTVLRQVTTPRAGNEHDAAFEHWNGLWMLQRKRGSKSDRPKSREYSTQKGMG